MEVALIGVVTGADAGTGWNCKSGRYALPDALLCVCPRLRRELRGLRRRELRIASEIVIS